MENAVRQKRKRHQLAESKMNSPLIRRAVFLGTNSIVLIICQLITDLTFKAKSQTETKRYFRDVHVGVNPFQKHQFGDKDFAM